MSTPLNEAINPTRGAAEERVYVWSLPGSPIKVHIDLVVIDQIRLQISAEHPQAGGILLGQVQAAVVQIRSLLALTSLTPEVVAAALKQWPASREMVVGYYRVETADVLRLSAEDIELAKSLFPPPSSTILLIHPGTSDAPRAALFFWPELLGSQPLTEFVLDSVRLSAKGPQPSRREPKPRPVPPRPPDSATSVPPEASSTPRGGIRAPWRNVSIPWRRVSIPWRSVSIPWRTISISIGAIAGLAGLAWLAAWSLPKVTSRSPAVQVAARPASELRPKFDLRAERAAQDFRLTWDTNSPWVKNASAGLLTIQDGRGRKEIALSGDQLRSGSVLYQPFGEQVQMQLSLVSPTETVASESVTMILAPGGTSILSLSPTPPGKLAHRPGKMPQDDFTAERLEKKNVEQLLPPEPEVKTSRNFQPPPPKTSAPLQAVELPVRDEVLPAIVPPPTETLISKVADAVPLKAPQTASTPQSNGAPVPPAIPPPDPQPKESSQGPANRTLSYTPPIATSQVMPRPDAAIRSMLVNAVEIEMKLQIDAEGRVVGVEPVKAAKGFNQHLARAAVEAALRWRFTPARLNGKAVPSVQNVKFVFQK